MLLSRKIILLGRLKNTTELERKFSSDAHIHDLCMVRIQYKWRDGWLQYLVVTDLDKLIDIMIIFSDNRHNLLATIL